MTTDKPKNYAELKSLVETGDVEVLLEEDFPADESLVRYLILDNRRTYDEGEIYELVL